MRAPALLVALFVLALGAEAAAPWASSANASPVGIEAAAAPVDALTGDLDVEEEAVAVGGRVTLERVVRTLDPVRVARVPLMRPPPTTPPER